MKPFYTLDSELAMAFSISKYACKLRMENDPDKRPILYNEDQR